MQVSPKPPLLRFDDQWSSRLPLPRRGGQVEPLVALPEPGGPGEPAWYRVRDAEADLAQRLSEQTQARAAFGLAPHHRLVRPSRRGLTTEAHLWDRVHQLEMAQAKLEAEKAQLQSENLRLRAQLDALAETAAEHHRTTRGASTALNELGADAASDEGIELLAPDDAWTFFDGQVRARLGVNGEEFVRRWDAGEYDDLVDESEHPDIVRLAMLRPVGRKKRR